MAKQEFIRWAIIGQCGLYIGQRHTRRDAIAEHVSKARQRNEPEVSGSCWGGTLSADHIAIWKRCQKRGDRAVKIKISVQ